MSPVASFAHEVLRFQNWLLQGTDTGPQAAREAVIRITNLFAKAILLPQPWSDALSTTKDVERVRIDDMQSVIEACGRLPFNCYSDVFDPFQLPAAEPITGSIADDIADIYRDTASGLIAYQEGNLAGAIWEWGFNFEIHWGEHATSAIRALYCWLRENSKDYLFDMCEAQS